MFEDRQDAGRQLAGRLGGLGPADPVVLALPRGGVPVAAEVARALGAPLDLVLVRKIGAPGQEELAAGAVVDGEDGIVFNDGVLRSLGMRPEHFAPAIRRKLAEIEERRQSYLAGREPLPLVGRTAILVDDGIATGATVRAALKALRRRGPARIVLAVPVAPPEVLAGLRPLVDELVCLDAPLGFWAVGAHYRRFDQTPDAEVVALMREFRPPGAAP